MDPGNYQFRSCAMPFLQLGKTERARTFVNLDAGSDWFNYVTASLLMREGKLTEAQEATQRLSSDPFFQRQFLEACFQHGPPSQLKQLAHETEATLSSIPDPEPRYFQGAVLAFCDQQELGLRMIETAIHRNYCVYQALESDPLLAKSRQTPEFRRLLSAAKDCQHKFLAARNHD